MKIIIAGGRTFNDYELLCTKMDIIASSINEPIEVVCGCAKGADTLGEQWAISRGHTVTKFPADWGTYGKKAGFLRNKQMAEYADALVAFWDGVSPGTKSMIELAHAHNLKVRVVKI